MHILCLFWYGIMAALSAVIQFKYINYAVNSASSKQSAKCKHCSQTLHESKGTTSSFMKDAIIKSSQVAFNKKNVTSAHLLKHVRTCVTYTLLDVGTCR